MWWMGIMVLPEDEQPELETVGEVDGLDGMARGQDIVIPHGYQVLQGLMYCNHPL